MERWKEGEAQTQALQQEIAERQQSRIETQWNKLSQPAAKPNSSIRYDPQGRIPTSTIMGDLGYEEWDFRANFWKPIN